MLKEIVSDSFICDGQPRGSITFEMGFNVVSGGNSISNSIGKTTFLKVIDFVFGGDSYNPIASVIGSHEIKFTHQFDKEYRFIRCPDCPNEVSICKEDCYEIIEIITVEQFRQFLLEKYDIVDTKLSFDCITKPYIRLAKEKCDTKNIISYGKEINKTKEIATLEKLFKKYDSINDAFEGLQKIQEERKEFISKQHADFQLCILHTAEQFKKNETEIANLKSRLKEYTNNKNYEMIQQRLDDGKVVAEINEQLSMLSDERKKYLFQKSKIDSSCHIKTEVSENDFAELRQFFNDSEFNYRVLNDVQGFHQTIGEILSDELNEEKERLNSLIQAIDERILLLERQKAEINLPSMIPVEDFIAYSNIQERISLLERQNQNSDALNSFQSRLASQRKAYSQVQKAEITSIQNLINAKVADIYTSIIGNTCTVPLFYVDENQAYQYGIESDLGDGDGNKSIIAFDLSILSLTVLPYIIHDSRLYTGVDRNHVSNIIRLYSNIHDKQIFISIDDTENYTEDIRKIIKSATRIELGYGSKALYGRKFS